MHDNENKQRFFFKGKFFDTFEEVLEYERNWNNEVITPESVEYLLEYLTKDLFINLKNKNENYTNKQFINLVNNLFEHAIHLIESDN